MSGKGGGRGAAGGGGVCLQAGATSRCRRRCRGRPAGRRAARSPRGRARRLRAARREQSATSSGSVSINTRPSFTWIQRMSVRCQSGARASPRASACPRAQEDRDPLAPPQILLQVKCEYSASTRPVAEDGSPRDGRDRQRGEAEGAPPCRAAGRSARRVVAYCHSTRGRGSPAASARPPSAAPSRSAQLREDARLAERGSSPGRRRIICCCSPSLAPRFVQPPRRAQGGATRAAETVRFHLRQ